MDVRITNIQRGSLHDGPGLRAVVYFKGCSLSCAWCHNPESIRKRTEILYDPRRCILCGRCARACAEGLHAIQNGIHVIEREKCVHCGKCAEACPAGALSCAGETTSVQAVFEVVMRERPYFDATGGGVTLSGGECLLQPDAAAQLLALCRDVGIRTAMETALAAPQQALESVLPLTDLFICDLKHIDAGEHLRLTGAGNERILENLRYIAAHHRGAMWIRTPIIPGMNDEKANLEGIADFVASLNGRVERYEMLKYNNLSESKYVSMGDTCVTQGLAPQSDEQMEDLIKPAQSRLLRLGVSVCWS